MQPTRRRFLATAATTLSLARLGRAQPATAPADAESWRFLDNGTLRLGVDLTAGAAIGHLAPSSDPDANRLDHHDRGRFVQQSYYGDPDGSRWNGKPWRWNPVQGGDWRGNPATLLDFESTETTLRARSRPRNWGGGQELRDVTFEQTAALDGPVARVRFTMRYAGQKSHAARPQELPAVFVNPKYRTLVVYDGDAPWTGAAVARSVPGWPNESRKMTEHWAAYVDPAGGDEGVLAYVPVADALTCYNFGDGRSPGSCAYFAPVKTFAITPGLVWTYDAYLMLGRLADLRDRVYALHAATP